MKTGLIPAVVPAPLDAVARPHPVSEEAAGLAGPAIAAGAEAGSAGMSDAGANGNGGVAWMAAGAATTRSTDGDSARTDSQETMASQRIALSRLRIEALMLEAQAASANGDGERARAVARAVRNEAGAIRQALRSTLDSGLPPAAAAASTAVSSAVTRAQAAARSASAQDDGRDESGLAPWTAARSTRDSAAVEAAPAGVPTSTLHRNAYEALRRAQEVLDELARMDWSRAVDDTIGDAREDVDSAGTAAGIGLMNDLEAEDGALWSGYNGIA